MEHLYNLFDKKPEYCEKMLQGNLKATLKIDGTAFQVYVNDDNEIEYHKRSGNTSKLGPVIDEYTMLFVKSYSDAMSHIDKYKEVIVKNWKFLTFELFADKLFILSGYDKSMSQLNDLDNISKKIHCDCVPVLFEGKLSKHQYDEILYFCEDDGFITGFKKWTYKLFNDYKDFPKSIWPKLGDNIEGFVLNFSDGSQYKVDDPNFAKMHKDMTAKAKEESQKIKPILDELYEEIYEWMKDHAKKLDNDNWKSLNMNFINMCSDEEELSKLLEISKRLPTSSLDFVDSKLDSTIKRYMKKYGDPLKTLYWKYLYMLNKPKKRNYIVDKQFQQKVNNIIKSIYESYLNLHDYIIKNQNKV